MISVDGAPAATYHVVPAGLAGMAGDAACGDAPHLARRLHQPGLGYARAVDRSHQVMSPVRSLGVLIWSPVR